MSSETQLTFSLLKYFTTLEYDETRTSDCKYHIKLHTKQNKRHLRTPRVSPVKPIKQQETFDKSTHSCSIDKLPILVKIKIFKCLTHQNLIEFISAYPHYMELLIQPLFWTKLKINFDGNDEHHHIEHILKYLKYSLQKIHINFVKRKIASLECYLDHLPRLTHFTLQGLNKKVIRLEHYYLTELLINKLVNLRYIDIYNYEIDDDQLLRLAKNLVQLESIKLYAENISDLGLYNFVNISKRLVYIELLGGKHCKLRDSRGFQLLFTKHAQSLEALKLQSIRIGNNAFECVHLCKKLKELSIKNCKLLNIEICDRIGSIFQLQSLELDNNKGFDGQAFVKLFSQVNLIRLKRLHLKNCRLDDESLKLLAKRCPQLLDLALVKCFEITDDGVESLFEGLKCLESLVLDYLNTQLSVRVFKHVPNKMLKNIKYINIHNHMNNIESNDFDSIFTNICMSRNIQLVLSYDGEEN